MRIILAMMFFCVVATSGHSMENMTNLINKLFNNYNKIIRPIKEQSQPVIIYIDFFLNTINELDDVQQKLTTTGFLEVEWTDVSLKWTPSDYDGISRIHVSQDKIWLPDLALQNGFSAAQGMGDPFVLVEIKSNGKVVWAPNGIFQTKCKIDIRYFPFDQQVCQIEFGNWVSTRDLIGAEIGSEGMKMQYFHDNGQWDLVATTSIAVKITQKAKVRFIVTIQRKPLYFIVNLVIPIVLLSFLINFTFVLPVQSGEKMGYSVTVYLAFAVFLTIISTLLPSGSQTTPLIGTYMLILLITGTVIIMLTALQLRLQDSKAKVSKFWKTFTRFCRRTRCKPREYPVTAEEKTENSSEEPHERQDDDDITWDDVTANLDFLYFWFFFVFISMVTIIMLTYIYVQSI